ncbi:MAG: hypothetical protein RXR02_00700 [Thermoproteus sp.]
MILLDYDPASSTALISTGKARCGQLEVRHVAVPRPPVAPPAVVDVIRSPNGGVALVGALPTSEEEIVLDNADQAIEGEISRGRLRGVVCNREVDIKVYAPYRGPALALVPVRRIGKMPKAVVRLLVYRPALP